MWQPFSVFLSAAPDDALGGGGPPDGGGDSLLFAHYDYIARLVLKTCRRCDLDYDDVFNHVFEGLPEKARAFDGRRGAQFKTFITVVVNRRVISFMRRGRVRFHGLDELVELPSGGASPAEEQQKKENEEAHRRATQLLPAAMERLSRDERIALKLKYWPDEGGGGENKKRKTKKKSFNLSDIAESLGLTRHLAKRLIQNAEDAVGRFLRGGGIKK